ncbi:hypothetical protein GCM10027162_33270 [Streptomyces incanus]
MRLVRSRHCSRRTVPSASFTVIYASMRWHGGRGTGRWSEYPGGTADFLCRAFRAEFDRCPLGDLSLWGAASPRFLHRDEQQRLRDPGINPWTAELDPHAGMFGD